MSTLYILNSEVTDAVFRAEGSLQQAITHYDRLVRAEQNIVDCSEAGEDERKIAGRGVENAKRILAVLQAAFSGRVSQPGGVDSGRAPR